MAKTKEEMAAYNKSYYEANKDRARARAKAWREANQERNKATNTAWREANAEKEKAYSKTRYEANREKFKAYYKAHNALLSDTQVAARLRMMGHPITPETIELKRTRILISRAIKELKNV